MFPKLFPEHVFEMFIGVLPKKKKKSVLWSDKSGKCYTVFTFILNNSNSH